MNNKPSKEIQQQALKVAKGTHKKGQSKEDTKLIAQGIEKGIAEYKKQQNIKSRERDKLRKQQLKIQQTAANQKVSQVDITNEVRDKLDSSFLTFVSSNKLPWALLIISWLGFVFYFNRDFF